MRAAPGRRADYAAFSQHSTRWRDNDVFGHMNNAVHYQFFDSAVTGPLLARGFLDPAGGETLFLVVESGCRYHAEIGFPQVMTAGLRVGHLGRSSVRYEIGLFADDAEEAAAEGHFVHVHAARATRRPLGMEGALREYLESLSR